jgi:tight adherence protein B
MAIETTLILASILAFFAVFALVEGLDQLLRGSGPEGKSKFRRRLRNLSAGGGHGREKLLSLRDQRESEVAWLQDWLIQIPRLNRLDRLLQQSGVSLSLSGFLLIQLGVSSVILVIWLLALPGNPWVVLPLGLLIGFGGPWLVLEQRRKRRRLKFIRQLPDALDFLARAMRAGNPFTVALRAAAAELPEPVSAEFALAFEEINFGLDVEDALRNLAHRVGGADIGYFATAVIIQRRTGGNLADILNRIATMLRSRERTTNEVRIQAAEMKLSAHVLIALPLLVAAFLMLFQGDYMSSLLSHALGPMLIGLQLAFMLMGYLIMRAMINFRI